VWSNLIQCNGSSLSTAKEKRRVFQFCSKSELEISNPLWMRSFDFEIISRLIIMGIPSNIEISRRMQDRTGNLPRSLIVLRNTGVRRRCIISESSVRPIPFLFFCGDNWPIKGTIKVNWNDPTDLQIMIAVIFLHSDQATVHTDGKVPNVEISSCFWNFVSVCHFLTPTEFVLYRGFQIWDKWIGTQKEIFIYDPELPFGCCQPLLEMHIKYKYKL
jgi:hypothetical protein